MAMRTSVDGDTHRVGAWTDGEFAYRRCWRSADDGVSRKVLAVGVANLKPNRSTLERLAHEYGLREELDGTWALRPIELVQEVDRTLLVLEDFGGEPLKTLLGAPMEVGVFLRLAIAIAEALREVHYRGLVHKDIKPANIFVEPASGQVQLSGFGIASRLSRERQALAPPEFIAGTLAYMAPEQTGRMNRSIDSRSDLYSLGVTFYQMLTGRLPFTASDPMEWVHCHIARQPATPGERRPTIPAPVSAIIMKLLAKTAEERYQTAVGLERDLRRCLAAWEAHGRIDDFPLGVGDTSDRLLITERLYGREREVETLLSVFDRVVKNGAPELVLISGYSGIGKSSVVNELHKALVPPHGLFASGKFDQYKRDIPYSTLVQAFQSLVRPLLGRSDSELTSWRGAFVEALGPNARLMTDLIPELKLIMGDQPPVPELEPQQAQRRFQLIFRRFIGVFARPEHPLALFLDDLQWLDGATLDLMEDLLIRSDLQHLMLIGAYRDNEVDAAHPLTRKLDAIRQGGARVHEIRLAPLAREHIERLIADTLHCELERAAQLAQLVHEKTAGNPFFMIQFLYSLAEEGLLRFDHDAACWSWELDRIQDKGYADNVVSLMVEKLTRLPAETQQALQQLASLGNVAAIPMISIVLGTKDDDVHAALWPAVRQELVERLEGQFRFTHDRVQEAAYSLIPQALRAEVHLRIGRLLAAQTPPEEREEAIFDIVNQLNRGAALISQQEERDQLAELNLIAGKRAKESTAYASALTYLNAGAELLADYSSESRHELAFALELNRAECEYLTGQLTIAEERLAALSTRAGNTLERATVACLRADVYMTLDQSSRAVAVGLDYLRHLGIDWSPHPTEEEARHEYERIWSQLGSRNIEELVELPLMTDPASLATIDVLSKIASPAYYTDDNLCLLAMCWAVNLSLERGNCDGSCFAYEWVAMVAGARFGDYQAAYRLGRLGYELIEQLGLKRHQAGTYLIFGNLVVPWTRHIRKGRDLLRRGFEAATRIGDLTYAAYCCDQINTNMLAAGDPLDEVQREAEHGLAFAKKAQFGFVADIITSQLGLIRTLRGLTPTFGSFDDEQFDERRIERRFSENPDLAFVECWYSICKLQARFFAGDCASAIAASSRTQQLLWTSVSQFHTAEYHFYGALAQAACCDSAPSDARQQHLDALAAHHRQLQVWAENCPENFENRAALAGAEIARLEGRDVDAMHLYEQAIRSARVNGFIHNEALAYEVAARFYAVRGFEEFSSVYLQNARYGYLRWGADGKVRQLEETYPHLRTEDPAPETTSTIATPIERLDLATVIKVSQTVSGEMVLEKLIDTLMRTAVAQAGAERALLILARGTLQQIAAEARTSGDTLIVHLRDESVAEAAVLPESVLHYVLRTRESVILDDAATQSQFADDPYICQRQARSVLCLPLLIQAKLIGVLYLENNFAPRVFSPARISVLKLLASQAAISLENTRLYRDLAEREAKIRRLVDSNIIGILIFNFDGQILEANDAFLEMVGYTRDDLATRLLRWTDLTPPEWQAATQRAVAQIRATGACDVFEQEYFRRDGSRVPVLIGGAAATEEAKTETVAFVLDLTERKRAEAELRESEQNYRTLFESIDEGFCIIEVLFDEHEKPVDYLFLQVSPSFERQTGIKNAAGRRMREIAPLHEEHWFEIYGRIALTGEPMRFENEAKQLGRWYDVYAFRVEDPERRLVGILFNDITHRKRAEAEARDSERRYREVQAELAHAGRVATMGQITASIAHEMKQPIASGVINALAALRWLDRQTPDLGEVRQALACIVNECNRASEVIDRIRDLVRKAPPRKDRLEINGAIREVIELTRGEAMKNGVSVQMQLAEDLPLIEGDRVQLQQVILNLIINAIQAMTATSDGQRELLISTGKTDFDGVLVAVRDSGPGLAPGTLEHVFEAFHTTKPGGLGLGLSICRSIIEVHGGQLWASQNLPRGAVFEFTVPAVATIHESP